MAQESAPLVSVITPTLNAARFIRATMWSVAAQTYSNVEHIVVDGGSTDGTLERVERLPGVTVISTTKPGMYAAINVGLERARGQYMGYLNGDDLYYPWTVEAAVGVFRRDPDIGMVYGHCDYIDENNEYLFRYYVPEVDLGLVARSNPVPQPTVFWTRSALEKVGKLDEAFHCAGDMEFWIRLLKGVRVARVDQPQAAFRLHRESLSERRSVTVRNEIEKIQQRHGAFKGPIGRLRRLVDRVFLLVHNYGRHLLAANAWLSRRQALSDTSDGAEN